MKRDSRRLLSLLNKAMYFIAFAMLISAAILTLVFRQALAQNPGSVWTNGDDVCSVQQNKNAYNPGDTVYIHYRDFLPGTYDWYIRPPSNGSVPVASGQITITSTGFGCIFAYIVGPSDEGEYSYGLGSKNDNYHVCGNGKVWDGQHCVVPTSTATVTATRTATASATMTHTATATQTPTSTATATATDTATPTATFTATATATATRTATTTASLTAAKSQTLAPSATLRSTDPFTPTATTPAPSATSKPPTNTPVPTKVSTLPIPPTGATPLIIPVTGEESLPGAPITNLTRGLFLGGLAIFGYAVLFSGLRKMLKH